MNDLTIGALTCEALEILHRELAGKIEFVEINQPGTKIGCSNPITGGQINQKMVDIVAGHEDMKKSIADFSEQYIEPAIKELGKQLKADGIAYTHPLMLPKNIATANHLYDGISMRGLMEDRVVWANNVPLDVVTIRFDILYSGARL